MKLTCGICHKEEEADEGAVTAAERATMERIGDFDVKHTFAICDDCADALVEQGALKPGVGVKVETR